MRSISRVLVVVGLIGAGCSRRPVVDGEGGGGEGTTTTATTESMSVSESETTDGESATGALEPCPPEGPDVSNELTRCGGECVALAIDAENCGECGHVCPLAEYWLNGACRDHECAPTLGPCVRPDDAIPNCEALCNTVGQHCAGDWHNIWFSNQDEASCNDKTSSSITYDAPCNAPFEWDRIGTWGHPAVGARCTCTNEE